MVGSAQRGRQSATQVQIKIIEKKLEYNLSALGGNPTPPSCTILDSTRNCCQSQVQWVITETGGVKSNSSSSSIHHGGIGRTSNWINRRGRKDLGRRNTSRRSGCTSTAQDDSGGESDRKGKKEKRREESEFASRSEERHHSGYMRVSINPSRAKSGFCFGALSPNSECEFGFESLQYVVGVEYSPEPFCVEVQSCRVRVSEATCITPHAEYAVGCKAEWITARKKIVDILNGKKDLKRICGIADDKLKNEDRRPEREGIRLIDRRTTGTPWKDLKKNLK
ncbi:hypothetical protein B0H11DRAFT_1916103 [Mycena galericulata]|nr:hypothetical protein B0H11DRAFT_1916103 [Mycena galericulata]